MILPHYLAIGVTKIEILHSTINGLTVYDDAYKLKMEAIDGMLYLSGIYTFEAVSIAVSNAFRGKGKKAIEYRKNPILQETKPEKDKIKRERMAFTNRLDTLRANYRIAHQMEKNDGK